MAEEHTIEELLKKVEDAYKKGEEEVQRSCNYDNDDIKFGALYHQHEAIYLQNQIIIKQYNEMIGMLKDIKDNLKPKHNIKFGPP